MESLEWLEDEQLLRFFHRNKTEMSCIEKPHIFLSQLRDHDLVPEDQYKMVIRMKSKDNIRKAIYEILDWLERQRSKRIKEFWCCVFKETILNENPTLRLLRNSLMDGSFQFGTQQLESVETEESDEEKRKEVSEDEGGVKKSVKKKRKLRTSRVCDDDDDDAEEEQAGPSTVLTPRKKSKKLCFSSPLKKGEKTDIWTWPIYKLQLPVTCGDKTGTLNRRRLAEGEECIVVGKRWFTPQQFERFAERQTYKNWKMSIRCNGTPLGEIIKDGHLKAGRFYTRSKQAKKSQIPSGHANTVSDREEDEDEDCDLDEEDRVSSSSKESCTAVTDEGREDQAEQQPEVSHDSSRKVFSVTCRALSATLHKKRFASGTCGKSIRTETSWMTPMEFIKEASCPPDASWRKEIECQGEPLSVLVEANILGIHSLLCCCKICKPDCNDLEHQKNDDECGICKSEEDEKLVMCDHCPRSFHQKCHLPHVEDTILREDTPWMCTFCVFRTTREWLYWDEMEREAVMSRQISQRLLQCQYLLLYLCSADEEQIFTQDPCLYLQRYSTVIQTPMWLGKIADNLQKQLYQTVREFESDVQLVFTNCALYNRDNAEFLAVGNRLKELFDREFMTVFNISEETVD